MVALSSSYTSNQFLRYLRIYASGALATSLICKTWSFGMRYVARLKKRQQIFLTCQDQTNPHASSDFRYVPASFSLHKIVCCFVGNTTSKASSSWNEATVINYIQAKILKRKLLILLAQRFKFARLSCQDTIISFMMKCMSKFAVCNLPIFLLEIL